MAATACQSDLLTTVEAAEFLGMSPGSMEVWRSTRRYAIPYIKVGRLVRYRKSDLLAWLESRVVSPSPVEA